MQILIQLVCREAKILRFWQASNGFNSVQFSRSVMLDHILSSEELES